MSLPLDLLEQKDKLTFKNAELKMKTIIEGKRNIIIVWSYLFMSLPFAQLKICDQHYFRIV